MSWPNMLYLLLLTGLTLPSSTGAQQPPLRVQISPGFRSAYELLVPEFEGLSGISVITERGVSSGSSPLAIPGRVARGEQVDVVILAEVGMDELEAQGLIVPDSRTYLASTGVGMAVREGRTVPAIGSVRELRAALLDAESVAHSAGPSGRHLSEEVFPALGISGEVGAKTVMSNNVPETLLQGEADVGFQQVSELAGIDGVVMVGPLPPELQLRTGYSAAVVRGSAREEDARALIAYMAAEAADPVVERMGLERTLP